MFNWKKLFTRPIKIDLVRVALEARVKTLEDELKDCREHKGRRRRKPSVKSQIPTPNKKK